MENNIVFDRERIYGHHTRDEVPEPGQFYLHTHDCFEVYCFLSGDADYWVEGSVYHLSPGDLIINRSGESHRLLLRSTAPYERISLHFDPSLLSGIDESASLLVPFLSRPLGFANHYRAGDFPDGVYRSLLMKAVQDGSKSDSPDGKVRMLCHLSAVLSELYGVWEEQQISRQPSQGEHPTESDADPLAGEMIAYINENLFSDLSLPQIAAHFFLSQTYVSKRFVKATGISVWNYVKIKRLHHARAAIRNGQSPHKVCFDCGYRDYSSFYRAYLSQFGVSPAKDKPEPAERN